MQNERGVSLCGRARVYLQMPPRWIPPGALPAIKSNLRVVLLIGKTPTRIEAIYVGLPRARDNGMYKFLGGRSIISCERINAVHKSDVFNRARRRGRFDFYLG